MENEAYIEAYLLGQLSPEEKAKFEERLSKDNAFKQEVKLYQNLLEGIRDVGRNDLKKELQDLEKEFTQIEGQTFNLRPTFLIGVAAAICLILIPLYIFYTPNSLFDQYFEPYDNFVASVERGETATNPYQQAFQAYENADYAQAIEVFESLTAPQKNEEAVIFYLGLSYLAQKITDPAKVKLLQVIAMNRDFKEQAQWYLALAYVQDNQKNEARSLLQKHIQSSKFQKAKAQELLNQL